MLARNPGFTFVAVLTLALGIGANTAMFSAVNAIVLRPLPFPHPHQLVALGESNPKVSGEPLGASFLNFTDWSQKNHVFEHVAAYRGRRMTLVGRGDPQRVSGIGATSGFFPLVGVTPHLGRTLIPKDEQNDQSDVVVISYGLWQRLFGGARSALGQTLTLDNVPRTIVGVLPRDFRFLQDAQFFTPLDAPKRLREMRGVRFLRVLARMKPDVPLRHAQIDMDRIAANLAKDHANSNEGWGVSLVSLQDQVVGGAQRGLLLLLGTVGLVLLIACANVANLLLSRGVHRQKEMAIRMALGAGKVRVLRLLIAESLLLSLAGGATALVMALWGIEGVRALAPLDLPRAEEIRLDGHVLAFTLLITALTGLLFGSAPARQAIRVDLQDSLRDGTRSTFGGQSRLRELLVISEVALSFIVLVGAGLLGRSFVRLLSVDPGFRTEHRLAFDVRLPQYKYAQDFQAANFFRNLLDQAKGLRGVRSIALTLTLPLSGNEAKNSFAIEGRKAEEAEWANLQVVSPDYFRAMGIPVVQGRVFTERDTKDSSPVAIINQGMARTYWPAGDAIGKRLLFGGDGPMVVGVVGNVKQAGLAAPTAPEIYLPYWQQAESAMTVVAEADSDPLQLVGPLRALVQSLDEDQPIEQVQTLDAVLAHSVAEPRQVTLLLGISSVLALMLVTVGIYSVISCSVSRRTQEIGIRMAMGAERRHVFRLVVGQTLLPTFVGVAVGLAGALVLTRLLTTLLFEVRPTDPLTFIAVTTVLALVALVAGSVPARRAMSVDPMVALRHE
jgi:putative ABC transport system permease protein